ncbi:MAG: hypothetical protein JRE81_04270 [Deltaproteobacteria bacterium]|nr:hypothetical protein [Deltaproteobacteria bacterium]
MGCQPTGFPNDLQGRIQRSSWSHLPNAQYRATVRRLLIEGTPYAVFYSVDPEAKQVLIAAVWSRARGSGPPVP